MKDKKKLQPARLTDFCDLEEWYTEKKDFKEVMMKYIEDHGREPREIEGVRRVPELKECERGIAEDNKGIWFATLSIDPYSEGHTIVVSSKHYDDISDFRISQNKSEVAEFWSGVHQCARRLKEILGPERIYLASLCDGVEHLHIHLIPRYKEDAKKKGFGFMGERERLYNEGILHVCPRSVPSKVIYLKDLAKKLQFKPE
jgi:diadenosine tetraphosphate (Ap4A) HIT family hydrolase